MRPGLKKKFVSCSTLFTRRVREWDEFRTLKKLPSNILKGDF